MRPDIREGGRERVLRRCRLPVGESVGLRKHGTLRFTQPGKVVGRTSQKVLAQTVRRMEQDGLVRRTVHPVIPPHVDYALTSLGESLGVVAFCGVWIWAETHHAEIEQARAAFAPSKQTV